MGKAKSIVVLEPYSIRVCDLRVRVGHDLEVLKAMEPVGKEA
jgi:hypothetical protein